MKKLRCILVGHHDDVGKAIVGTTRMAIELIQHSRNGWIIKLYRQPLFIVRKRK